MEKNYLPYLSLQCARFGAITGAQAKAVMKGLCCHNKTYNVLRQLVQLDWLEYHLFPKRGRTLHWRPTPRLWKQLSRNYGFVHSKELRESDLMHAYAVFETLVTLAQFENVTGVATEYELSRHGAGDFLDGRTPDAIIRLTQGTRTAEVAVEVETCQKSKKRIRKILECYANAFMQPYSRCTGVIIVTTMDRVDRAYQNACDKLPKEIRSRIQIVEIGRVQELPVGVYGYRLPGPVNALEKLRIVYPGGATYDSINSRTWDFKKPSIGHISAYPVTQEEEVAQAQGILNA